MKILFLDFDGVICLSSEWGSRYNKKGHHSNHENVHMRFDNFNKKGLVVLNSIIDETDCEIVVSSDWKNWADIHDFGQLFDYWGIKKKPIGVTESYNSDMDTFDVTKIDPNEILEYERCCEIKHWLRQHPLVSHWVAVDDLDLGVTRKWFEEGYENEWGLTNFVHTPKENEGLKQCGVKTKIVNMLNRPLPRFTTID
jgi:hypothetical protein